MHKPIDVSNHEHVTIVFCHVTERMEVMEVFIGLYKVPAIDSNTLTGVLTDSLNLPAINATSEHSFSVYQRVKFYKRSTMLQEQLNHLLLMHVYKMHLM